MIHFIKGEVKKEIILLSFECIQQVFNIGELSSKEVIRFENATLRYIFSRKARLEIIY